MTLHSIWRFPCCTSQVYLAWLGAQVEADLAGSFGEAQRTQPADDSTPTAGSARRTRSLSATPAYSPMQISPADASSPLRPLHCSGSKRPFTGRPISTAEAAVRPSTAAAAPEARASPGSAERKSRPIDSTAALELLADCAAAEAATSRKAKGADSLEVTRSADRIPNEGSS